jgi:protein involved in polysaccharide export with SLBB domain
MLRTRLQEGDFEVGDRIIASFEGVALTRTDTFVVQTGKIAHLGEPLGDLPVAGVLRFEIADSIAARVGKYYKNEVVHVTPLMRISISGAVRAPGVYYARRDLPITDLITRNAGQDASTDLRNIVIRRGADVLWSKDDVGAAMSDGLTLEQLNLEQGDEIVVGTRSANRWLLFAQIGVPIMSAIILPLLLRR